MKRVTLHIDGMSCGHCLNAVNKALTQAAAVQVESVQIGRAVVSYDEAVTSPERIAAAVGDAGYRATATPAEESRA